MAALGPRRNGRKPKRPTNRKLRALRRYGATSSSRPRGNRSAKAISRRPRAAPTGQWPGVAVGLRQPTGPPHSERIRIVSGFGMVGNDKILIRPLGGRFCHGPQAYPPHPKGRYASAGCAHRDRHEGRQLTFERALNSAANQRSTHAASSGLSIASNSLWRQSPK
jgi:hypothetical protein